MDALGDMEFPIKKIFNVVSYEISTPRAEYAKENLI